MNNINPFGPSGDTVRAVFAALPATEQARRLAEQAQEEAWLAEQAARKAAEEAESAARAAENFASLWDVSFAKSPMWDTDGQPVATVTICGTSYGARMSSLGGYDGGGRAADESVIARRDGSGPAGYVVARGDDGQEWSLRGLGIVRTATGEWLPKNARPAEYRSDYADATAWTGEVFPECWDHWVDPEILAARAVKAAKKEAKAAPARQAETNPFAALSALKVRK